jgi:hypothetical protein
MSPYKVDMKIQYKANYIKININSQLILKEI